MGQVTHEWDFSGEAVEVLDSLKEHYQTDSGAFVLCKGLLLLEKAVQGRVFIKDTMVEEKDETVSSIELPKRRIKFTFDDDSWAVVEELVGTIGVADTSHVVMKAFALAVHASRGEVCVYDPRIGFGLVKS